MSTETSEGDVDFERVEYPATEARVAGVACRVCTQPITSQYWEVGGRALCPGCLGRLDAELARARTPKVFGKAALHGVLVAFMCSCVWYGIVKVTGYELSLVSIAMGVAIGWVVKRATGGIGGRRYQALAMFLTYSSIVMTYVPMILHEIASRPAATEPLPAISIGKFLLAWVFLLGLTYAIPFLAGASNLMGLLIIGIGLYEAWKFARATPLPRRGPFELPTDHEPTPKSEAISAPTPEAVTNSTL